jgi:hypothetical protein
MLWSQQVQTERTIPKNELDTRVHDNEKETCMLRDVALSGDRNEKTLKFKDLIVQFLC